jgi:hypothetical protein
MDAVQRRSLAQAVAGDNPLQSMSPLDLLKLRRELTNRETVSPEQRTANLRQTAEEGLGIVPIIGNALSAKDAASSGYDAYQAFGEGDWRRGALATALAGLSGVGAVTGLPTSKLAGRVAKDAGRTVNIFAGPTAKTADHAMLAKAQEMKNTGASRDDIWRETGWDVGNRDGVPRFEIDDSWSADVSPMDTGLKSFTSKAPNMLHHPPYYRAYPEAADMTVQYLADGSVGGKYFDKRGFVASGDRNMRKSTALHELQHDAQSREGFAKGGNPEEMADVVRAANVPMSGHEAYRLLAGEVEARNVQARRNMSADQRRATPPWLTQDVPDDEQLVRFHIRRPAR